MRTLLLLCLVSCNLDVNGSKLAGPPAVPSEGLSATQVRPVADFDRVRSEGFVDVIAAVGPEHSAEITCDDVMLPHIDTVVERGTLFVRTRSSGDGVSANARCLVKAAAPAWVAVESTLSGRCTA